MIDQKTEKEIKVLNKDETCRKEGTYIFENAEANIARLQA